MFLCIPLTTKGKDSSCFYIKLSDNYFQKKSYIITSQPKAIDKKRFIEKMGILSETDFESIKKELIAFWF